MLVVAFLVASGCADPCGLAIPVPAPVDVGLAAAGGGAGADLTVVSIAFPVSYLIEIARVDASTWAAPVFVAGLAIAWPIGAVAAASERADLRGASPLIVGLAVGVPAALAGAGAGFFFYQSSTEPLNNTLPPILYGLGILAAGAVVQGVAGGVATAMTGGE
jgi:hypothetical protein